VKHRREQGAHLVSQTSQPAAIVYDDPSGHLLILSSHKSMIIQVAVLPPPPGRQTMITQALHHKPGL
jgi:hypothetical protein